MTGCLVHVWEILIVLLRPLVRVDLTHRYMLQTNYFPKNRDTSKSPKRQFRIPIFRGKVNMAGNRGLYKPMRRTNFVRK